MNATLSSRYPKIKTTFGALELLRSDIRGISEQFKQNIMLLRRNEIPGLRSPADYAGTLAIRSAAEEPRSKEYLVQRVRRSRSRDVEGRYESAPLFLNAPNMVYQREISHQQQAPSLAPEGQERKLSEGSVAMHSSATSPREGMAQLPMDHITDEVMRRIDHRLQVWRERTGNI